MNFHTECPEHGECHNNIRDTPFSSTSQTSLYGDFSHTYTYKMGPDIQYTLTQRFTKSDTKQYGKRKMVIQRIKNTKYSFFMVETGFPE